jgi:regulator of cell morphogenesis and NO signaling
MLDTTLVTTTSTLGELVAAAPGRAAVLDRLGLDYCCHGQRSLADACAEAGLDPASVAALLDQPDAIGAGVDHPIEPAALAEYIEGTHHRYLHDELPAVAMLAAKVRDVHRERHPELDDVSRLVAEVGSDLEPHLLKEERILFPAIRALVSGAGDFPFGTVQNPIRMMSTEHDRCGELLVQLRTASNDYVVPDDACASYRSLYERLEALEADTHRHIHLENNVLFPAAVAIEGRRHLGS